MQSDNTTMYTANIAPFKRDSSGGTLLAEMNRYKFYLLNALLLPKLQRLHFVCKFSGIVSPSLDQGII